MKLCIPTTSDEGREARVSGHFGRAPYYTFVDTDTGAVEAVENPGHDAVHPPDFVMERGISALAVVGLGQGAYMRFTRAGVQLLKAEAPDVAGVLEALEEGRLRALSESEDVHQGHHHHGGEAH